MREVVVVSAVRTAVGKSKRGKLRHTRPEYLLSEVMKAAIQRAQPLKPEEIDDVVVGTAFPEAEQGMNLGRVAAVMAGLPNTVPGMTINRFCSSGLQSVAQGAAAIMAGWQDIVLGGGVESMSMIPMGGLKPAPNPTLMKTNADVYTSMGITAENVASRFDVSRQEQDEFALLSNQKAGAAIAEGRFKEEILPIQTGVYENGKWEEFVFDTDEGPRPDSTIEGLGKLKPAFKIDGSVTAGNSSQTSDGAAAVLIAAREVAEAKGLPILAKLRAYQVVGVDPDIMGVGPRYAIPKALEAAGLEAKDIDLFEINEAFASQAIYCVRELGLDRSKVNVNGGAIALGHPLGCTGAKLTATLLHEMKRRGSKYGVVSMCIGGGMGAAAVFERI